MPATNPNEYKAWSWSPYKLQHHISGTDRKDFKYYLLYLEHYEIF